jgi:hypothetical protein
MKTGNAQELNLDIEAAKGVVLFSNRLNLYGLIGCKGFIFYAHCSPPSVRMCMQLFVINGTYRSHETKKNRGYGHDSITAS